MEQLLASWRLIAVIFSTMVAAIVYFSYRKNINFWLLDFWYGLPIIGKVARLGKDHAKSKSMETDGWYQSEVTLCRDYKTHIHLKNRPEFSNNQAYLRKAGDNGRSLMPLYMTVIMVTLVAAESLGFSYLLGTWLATEGSENTHTLLMFAIVFVLAVVLAFITHAAGYQLYRSSLVKRNLELFKQGVNGGDHQARSKIKFQSIGLDQAQQIDDDKPDYSQLLARVCVGLEKPSYYMVIITFVVVSTIAGLSTWMRYENLVRMQTEQTLGVNNAMDTATPSNPFANADQNGLILPQEVTQPQKTAQEKGLQESKNSLRNEGLAAFLTLAIIFIITQIVGIYTGFKWGFAGKESKQAYDNNRGFATYEQLLSHYEPRIDRAQAMLQRLQQKMLETSIHEVPNISKNFMDFWNEIELQKSRIIHPNTNANFVHQPAADNAQIEILEKNYNVNDLLMEFNQIEQAAEKKEFLSKLPNNVRTELIDRIQEQETQREKQRAADLNAILGEE